MLRSLFASVAVASLAFASVACSGAAGDESTSGSAAVTESTAASTTVRYFRATDANNVAVVNEESTACANGQREDSCEVNQFDFTALNLTADETTALEAQVRSGQAMVSGTLSQISVPVGGGSRAIELQALLTVSSAWVAPSANVAIGASGNFQLVTKGVANCGSINESNGGTAATCNPYSLTMVNKGTTATAPAVDLTGSAASASATNSATTALDSSGLLTFGYFEGTAQGPKTFEVTAFFLPVTAN